MKRVIYIFTIALIASSCGTKEEQPAEENATETAQQETIVPNQLLSMDVDGMVCKMGCGGAIRSELYSIGGVSNVEFDFEDDRATNVASISFDSNLISVDEMIAAVAAINDGQFTIGDTSSGDLNVQQENPSTEPSSAETSTVDVSTSYVEMPNLLDLFSGLFL
ncbi:MAG: heavy-metal-associated domain-containing protein [Crocinitomicaceae bacterium]|nr:heavy-metal-associated domain-containing protein [Crocinitomicaceae bacterium]